MKVKELKITGLYRIKRGAIAASPSSAWRGWFRRGQFEVLSIKKMPRTDLRWILRHGGLDNAQVGVLLYVGTFDNKNELKLHRFYSHSLKRNFDVAGCFIQNIEAHKIKR